MPAKKSKFIRKDSGAAGTAPDVAKRLAQELIVRDKVDIIAGFSLTPDALAAADVSHRSEEGGRHHERGDRDHHGAFALFTSRLDPASAGHGRARHLGGQDRRQEVGFTMVTDYGPGIDSETAFQSAFKAAGGEIVGCVRFPVANPDFSAFAQQAKDSKADSVYIFVPGGEQPAALGKALAEHGVSPKSIKIYSSGELVNDEPLKSMGDGALGIISGWHYTWTPQVGPERQVREGHQRNPQRP